MPSPFNGISMSKKFYSLIIMDGFGIAEKSKGNAITLAGTPHIKALAEKYPHTQLGASGMNVGLPDGQMGNSEVGHLNMGAGRIVYQELTRITKAISCSSTIREMRLRSLRAFSEWTITWKVKRHGK